MNQLCRNQQQGNRLNFVNPIRFSAENLSSACGQGAFQTAGAARARNTPSEDTTSAPADPPARSASAPNVASASSSGLTQILGRLSVADADTPVAVTNVDMLSECAHLAFQPAELHDPVKFLAKLTRIQLVSEHTHDLIDFASIIGTTIWPDLTHIQCHLSRQLLSEGRLETTLAQLKCSLSFPRFPTSCVPNPLSLPASPESTLMLL